MHGRNLGLPSQAAFPNPLPKYSKDFPTPHTNNQHRKRRYHFYDVYRHNKRLKRACMHMPQITVM